jgi:hypothetical protein
VTNVAEALGHDAAGGGRDVDADPLAVEVLRGDQGGTATAKGVEDDVVGVAARTDDALEKGEGFLSGVAEPLRAGVGDAGNVDPYLLQALARHLIKIFLQPIHTRRTIPPL